MNILDLQVLIDTEGNLYPEFKHFLNIIFARVSNDVDTDVDTELTPQETRLLSKEQLNFLIDSSFIKKNNDPKTAWCNNCDSVCDVSTNKDSKKFLICFECSNFEVVSDINSIQYSTNRKLIKKAIANLAESLSQFKLKKYENIIM